MRTPIQLLVLACILLLIAIALFTRSCNGSSDIADAGVRTVIRDHYETVRVALPPLHVVDQTPLYRIEHDTIIDTALVRSLVATLDTARALLRAKGIRSTFSMDTSIAPHIERLVITCDETNRSIALNMTFRPIDTVLHSIDTTTFVTQWKQPFIEPYVQVAAIITALGQWSAQAAAGARLNATKHARGFIDGQIELGGTPRLRLGIDVSF